MSKTCSICFEDFDRNTCYPMICNPCGHCICKTCLESWLFQNRNNSCPLCRQPITGKLYNRVLIDLIEENYQSSIEIYKSPFNSNQNNLFQINNGINTKRNLENEVFMDKCIQSIIIIDNSGSMNNTEDGTLFILNKYNSIDKITGVIRWDEAVHKTIEIAKYNIKRGMITTYYLLNPLKKNKWVYKQDFIKLDPNESELGYNLEFLKTIILNIKNIRGRTPLDKITEYLNKDISINSSIQNPICLNIITDGEPDDKTKFTKQLHNLTRNHNIFLVINLCTNNDNVINYYNELDKTIGTELSGLDVIDDMEGELNEIKDSGNTFFVYSYNIHLCRMSGCFSIITDQMDEIKYPIHYITKFLREYFNIPYKNNLLNPMKPVLYLETIKSFNNLHTGVFNIKTDTFQKPIHLWKLKWIIWSNYLWLKWCNLLTYF